MHSMCLKRTHTRILSIFTKKRQIENDQLQRVLTIIIITKYRLHTHTLSFSKYNYTIYIIKKNCNVWKTLFLDYKNQLQGDSCPAVCIDQVTPGNYILNREHVDQAIANLK